MSRSEVLPGVDPVLHAAPALIGADEALEVAARTFEVAAGHARDLGSERDQTFLLQGPGDTPLAVMKISNPAEDPDRLDMEALAARTAGAVDPALGVAMPWPVPGPASETAAYRAPWHRNDATTQWVRMYDVLPGRARLDPLTLDDEALAAWGGTTARLGRALRGFIHPKAIRRLPWDVQHAGSTRPMLASIADRQARAAVSAVLDSFEQEVVPRWPVLRAQVVHGDLTVDNVLADERGRITGIVDFGDMSHTALVVDLASVLDSLGTGRTGADLFRVARLVLDGYQRITPLEGDELELMAQLWAARAAVGVAIASWRAAEGLEDAGFAERYNDSALATVQALLETGWSRAATLLGAPAERPLALAGSAYTSTDADDSDEWVRRRAGALGPALEPLSYAEPVQVAAADGVWLTGTDGRRYLDMYNNVPCVGHSHPRVATSVARQWRVLNTNLRYLHRSAIELAERLTATCPPSLDTVLFVNSGSEANDLAWRLAVHHTGNTGALCTAYAYHGITAALASLSPETLYAPARAGDGAARVQRWTPPDRYRGLHAGTEGFTAALGQLGSEGVAPAAVILDGVLQSDGVLDLEPQYVQELVRLTHRAGGLWIADEVQGGHCRTGEAMWSFQRFGIEPDLVTLGKPMGNGQPVGAVITRRELVQRFAQDTVFFSTFAGNQVSMAAAHAVLDVLDDERVMPRVQRAGSELRAAVLAATADDERVGDVRGMGLANGIEIVRDRDSKVADGATASRLANRLRELGVLVGTTGPAGNVLKVRPPLAFTADLVPTFVTALQTALTDVRP
jgi:4-aminobutyrate aminotransferase-like enzyme/Ser/Thr protein kinase RdoA (MazF antagonist)